MSSLRVQSSSLDLPVNALCLIECAVTCENLAVRSSILHKVHNITEELHFLFQLLSAAVARTREAVAVGMVHVVRHVQTVEILAHRVMYSLLIGVSIYHPGNASGTEVVS